MAEVLAPAHHSWVRDVTRDAVRHYAWGTGDNNPLWLDREYAQGSRWGSILAPPCFTYAIHETTVAPGLDDRQRIYTSVDWQWFDVIPLNSQLIASAQLVDTQQGPRGTIQTGRVDYHNQFDALIASAITTCLRPHEPRVLTSDGSDHRYSDDELATIEQAVLKESRRGAQPRYWEDTQAGERLATLNKGPLSIMDIVAWCAGALGVPDTGDTASTGGLTEEVATGPQQTAWLAHLVTDWAGDDGFLQRLSVRVTGQAVLGSTTYLNGEVTTRSIEDGRSVVELSLAATDTDHHPIATGSATVILPSRERGPVKLPVSRPAR
jgi:acyl dehydratase